MRIQPHIYALGVKRMHTLWQSPQVLAFLKFGQTNRARPVVFRDQPSGLLEFVGRDEFRQGILHADAVLGVVGLLLMVSEHECSVRGGGRPGAETEDGSYVARRDAMVDGDYYGC